MARELVTCGACRHFLRSAENPAQGNGSCLRSAWLRSKAAPYEAVRRPASCSPLIERYCGEFERA